MSENTIVQDGANLLNGWNDQSALDQSVFYPADMSALPTSTPNPSKLRRKSRRSWFETTPKGFKFDIAIEKPEPKKARPQTGAVEVLTLTHFTAAPRLGFGTLKLGQEKTCTLLLRNPHDYEQSVRLEKVPEKKHFSVPCKEFTVGAEESYPLEITWTPKDAGGCREMILMQIDGAYRLQAYVYGTVTAPPPQRKKTKRVGLLASKPSKPFSVIHTTSLANINHDYSPEKKTMTQSSKQTGFKTRKPGTVSKGPVLQTQSKARHGTVTKARKSEEAKTRRRSSRLSGKFDKADKENVENSDPMQEINSRESKERKAVLKREDEKNRRKMRRSDTYSNVSGVGLTVPIIQGETVQGLKDTSLLNACNISGIEPLEKPTAATDYSCEDVFEAPADVVNGEVEEIVEKTVAKVYDAEPSFLESVHQPAVAHAVTDEPSFMIKNTPVRDRQKMSDEPSFLQDPGTNAKNNLENQEPSFMENIEEKVLKKSKISALQNIENYNDSLEAENQALDEPSFLAPENNKSKVKSRSLHKRSGIQEIDSDNQPTGIKLLRSAKKRKSRSIGSIEAKQNGKENALNHESGKTLNDSVGHNSILEQLKNLKSFVHDKSLEIEKSGNESFHETVVNGTESQKRETFVKQDISRFSIAGSETNIRRGTFVTGPSKIKIIESQQPSEASPRRTTFTVVKNAQINKNSKQKVDVTVNVVLEEEEDSLEEVDEKVTDKAIDASEVPEQGMLIEKKERMMSKDSLENDSFETQTKSPQEIFTENIEVFTRRSTLTVTKSRPSDALREYAHRTGATSTCLFKPNSVVASIPEKDDSLSVVNTNEANSSYQKSSQNSTFEVPLEDSVIIRNSSFPSTPHCLLPNSPHLNDSKRPTHIIEKPKIVDLNNISVKQLFAADSNDIDGKLDAKVEETCNDKERQLTCKDEIDSSDLVSPPSANTRRKVSARRSVSTLRQSTEPIQEVTSDLKSTESPLMKASVGRKSAEIVKESNVTPEKPATDIMIDGSQVDSKPCANNASPSTEDNGLLFFIPLDNKVCEEAPIRPPVQRPNPSQFLKKRSNPVTQDVDRRCKRTKSENFEITQVRQQKPLTTKLAPSQPVRVTRQTIKSTGSLNDTTRRQVLKPKGGAVKGLAQSKLILSKKSKSAVPKLPLAFAAKNMFYDERWMEKQERGFVNWLNFILTPADEHQSSNVKVKVDAGKLTLDVEKGRNKLAPTNEILSFRTYAAQRKLNHLRKNACRLFQSDDVRRVMQKLEAEVESKRLLVRKDKSIHADVGAKQKILDMLLSYNPLWLRIGLETIYGEMVPLQSNNDVYGLSRFIIIRLLANPDIADEYAHPTVPHLYKDGYALASAQHTLKKFLMLVYFLDKAKQRRLIDHNPCLFCKDSDMKASKDLLLQFSRDFLSGEGDITKHLGYLDYKVTYSQTALDEFDYAVQKLAIDLRDGVRLIRVLEILCGHPDIGKTVRVPAISRLQKIHNVELVFKELAQQKIDPGTVSARDIVDGHREKTLSLLWTIILQYQVAMVINLEQLKEEIQILERSLRLRHKINQLTNFGNGVTKTQLSDDKDLHTQDERLNLLLKWCSAVCAFYDIKIENFTVSFSDGRALCHILHYYHPGLVPLTCIQHETTMTHVESMGKNCQQNLNCSLNDSLNTSAVFGEMEDPAVYEKLLANERENFKLLSEKVKEIGGVPMMLRSTDMSNTIPDEKVVVTYLMYLCARLLDIRQESRAARVIQHAWKSYRLRKFEAELKEKSRVIIVLQRAVRSFLGRRREIRRQNAAITLQKYWRGHRAKKIVERLRQDKIMKKQQDAVRIVQKTVQRYIYRRRYLQMKSSVILVQAYCRGYLVRRRLNNAATCIQSSYRGFRARKHVQMMTQAAIKIQAHFRGYQVRKSIQKECEAARIIQKRFRGYLGMKIESRTFATKRLSCVTIQKCWRKYMARKYRKENDASSKIQACWKGYFARKRYNNMRRSAITIQASVRGHLARQKMANSVNAALVIQKKFREYLVAKQCRNDYLKLCSAVSFIQCQRRMVVKRREYLRLVESAVKIQSYCRMVGQRRRFQKVQLAVCTIQKFFKSYQVSKVCRKEFLVCKGAAITIQAALRGHLVRKDMEKQVKAAVCLQSGVRTYLARRDFLALKNAAMVCQSRYRAKVEGVQQRENYQMMRNASVVIQKNYRAYLCRKSYLETKDSVIMVQALVRTFLCRKRFIEIKQATLTLQKYYRAKQLGQSCRRQYLIKVGASITLQSWIRGVLCLKQYRKVRESIIKLQALIKGHQQRQKYCMLKSSTIKIQRRFREALFARQQRKEFLNIKEAAVKIQSCVRMYQARKLFTEKRKSVVFLQSMVRGLQQRNRFLKMKFSAHVIEKYYQAKILKDSARKQFLICKGAAMTIQAFYRGFLVRQKMKRKIEVATKIQAQYRGHLQQKKFNTLKNAAIVCQRKYRSKLIARKTYAEYKRIRKSVVLAQSVYRGYMARCQYQTMRRSIIKLQAAIRGLLQRRKYQYILKSVSILQRKVRETIATRQQRTEFLRMRHAAIVIQSMWRMRTASWHYAGVRQSVIVLQANVRCFLERTRYNKRRSAAVTIQRQLRAYNLGTKCRKEFLVSKGAAMTIQAWYKGCLVRRAFVEKKQAAVMIQSNFRGYHQRQELKKLKTAVVVCQRYYRAKLMRRTIQEHYQHARSSVIRLQAALRMYLCRKTFNQMRTSVISLQAGCRMYLAQKRFRERRNAAISIQQWYRNCVLMRDTRHSFLVKKGAAITIQAYIKMVLIRKLYLQIVAERRYNAAVKIQTNFRRHLEMKRYTMLKNAAISCQRLYKAKCFAAVQRHEYIEKKKAAIVLQSQFRRHCHQRKFQQTKHSVLIIQSWYRGVKACQHFLKCVKAAKTLQTYWRAELLCRQEVARYHSLRDAALLIQSLHRGNVAREQFRKQKAAIKIQSFYRMFSQRSKFNLLKKSAVTLQSCVRSWHARKQLILLREEAEQKRLKHVERVAMVMRTNLSAIRIQRCYRKYKIMKIARERLNSILVIQRWMRAKLVWLHYIQDRRRVICIQSHVRTWLTRRDKAARVIQKAARVWLGSAADRKKHKAALKLQTLWRGHCIRKKIKSRRLTLLRKRIKEATESATKEKTLGNRTSSALDFLLKYKQISEVLMALKCLDVSTRLSGVCCEKMVETNAISVLYKLLRCCNRSIPHMEIITYTISILINLAKYEKTRPSLYEVSGCIDIIVELMQIYREKGQIFIKTCTLLGIIALDSPCKMGILADKKLVDRLQSIHLLTSRKHKLEENQRVTRARMNASSINATFMVKSPVKKHKIKPDWSLHKDKMADFENPLKAINFVLGNLGVKGKGK
ncbi:hypothetical protein ACF0H5_021834 [Mactra antiquata]